MAEQVPIAPVTVASDLTLGDLRAALAAGWRDFLKYPICGLVFGAIYVLAGLLLYYTLSHWGMTASLALLAAGFPFIAPLTAVGIYEASRRREAGIKMRLSSVLWRGDEQIMSMGVILFVAFGFWIMLAHGIYAVFMTQAGMGGITLEQLNSLAGILMLVVGSVVGGLIALALYSITIVSLPMLVDREVDFITAMIVSLGTIRSNPLVMLAWAAMIAILLFLALLPLFLGLLIVLPVLGHATWHLYRRVVGTPPRLETESFRPEA